MLLLQYVIAKIDNASNATEVTSSINVLVDILRGENQYGQLQLLKVIHTVIMNELMIKKRAAFPHHVRGLT